MPKLFEEKHNEKKILPIVFMIDTSGSMAGNRLASVISALETIMAELAFENSRNNNFEIRSAILTFSTGARWITPEGLELPENVNTDCIVPGGLTYYGEAFTKLDEKFNVSSFLNKNVGYICPSIVFLTDGNSVGDWVVKKEEIYNRNEWIRNSKKFVVAMDEADIEELYEIVLNSNQIIRICNEPLTENFLVVLAREIITEYKNYCYYPEHINCFNIIKKSIEILGCEVKQESKMIYKYSIESEYFVIN